MEPLKLCAKISTWAVMGMMCVGLSYSADSQEGAKAIVRVDKNATLEKFPSDKYAVPGKPVAEAGVHEAYSGGLSTGIFAGGPGVLKLQDWPSDEVATLLSGHVVIVSDDGKSNSFQAGDTFVIPKGFNGVFEMKTKMKEVYVEPGHH